MTEKRQQQTRVCVTGCVVFVGQEDIWINAKYLLTMQVSVP